MDKTTLGLVGAISSLAAVATVPAGSASAVEPVARAQSYAELLDPIPNAVERLALVNSQADRDGARLIDAQYAPDSGRGYRDGPRYGDNGPVAHHHHHHHHTYYRRHYRRYRHYTHHHHHHHHHNNY